MTRYAMNSLEFDGHRLVTFAYDPETNLQSFISIHRGSGDIPALGATRISNYPNLEEALNDALRLSRLMSYKAALAGLKYGGAKGVIVRNQAWNEKEKKKILKAYAEKVDYLGGHFITGSDVGISQDDVKYMHGFSKFFVGLSSKPERMTAEGLHYSLEVCAEEIFGSPDLSKRSIAVQGLGKIGYEIIYRVYDKIGKIYASDPDPSRVELVKREFPKVEFVDQGIIHTLSVDIFCPCALGHVFNHSTIEDLRCKMIVGGANDQLDSPQMGEAIHKKGILYAPDYIVNAGGLIGVVDEYENGKFDKESIKKRLSCIRTNLEQIIETSKKQNKPTYLVANEMAEKIFNNHT